MADAGSARIVAGVIATMFGVLYLGGILPMSVLAPAAGHDVVVVTDPVDGATLRSSPTAVTVVFAEPPLGVGNQIIVSDASGRPVRSGTPGVAGNSVTLSLTGTLAPGAYTMAWRVVSGDGHPVQGSIGFTVAAGPAAGAPQSGSAQSGSAQSGSAQSGSAQSGSASTAASTAAGQQVRAARDDGAGSWWPALIGALGVAALAGAAVLLIRRRAAAAPGASGPGAAAPGASGPAAAAPAADGSKKPMPGEEGGA